MQSGSKKQSDIARIKAEIAAAGVEILSAHCATDRIRLQYSPEEIITFGESNTLKKAISSSQAICRFFALLELKIRHQEESSVED